MMPKPPVWISTRRIPWPNRVNEVPVSVTARPVTQTEEVAVNRASTTLRLFWVVAWGRRSRQVPATIIARKPKTVAGPGEPKKRLAMVIKLDRFMGICGFSSMVKKTKLLV
jgi:hypothetical protein